jgi:ankyrin repeat protein
MQELYNAVKHGDIKRLEILVNLNTIDNADGTLIYAAVKYNRPNTLNWLIDRGADLNLTGSMLYSPISKAIAYGHLDCARLLLMADCDVTSTYGIYRTPLYSAINNHEPDIYILMLIDHGATITKEMKERIFRSRLHKFECIISTRLETRHKVIAILTIHKQKQGPNHFTQQDKYVIKMISKHIWSMRFHSATHNTSPQ